MLEIYNNMSVKDINIEKLEIAADMLKAMAHPVRIAILSQLEDGAQLTVTEIYQRLDIEQSRASHHLSIMKLRGILGAKRDGKKTYYYLKFEDVSKIVDCINRCV